MFSEVAGETMPGGAESFMLVRQAAGCFYGSNDHSVLASDYAGQTYMLGNNFEKVDSMANHSGD